MAAEESEVDGRGNSSLENNHVGHTSCSGAARCEQQVPLALQRRSCRGHLHSGTPRTLSRICRGKEAKEHRSFDWRKLFHGIFTVARAHKPRACVRLAKGADGRRVRMHKRYVP